MTPAAAVAVQVPPTPAVIDGPSGEPGAGPPVQGLDRHAAYRCGLCVDCKVAPHSAGRTRCNECHSSYTHDLAMGPAPAGGSR